MARDRDVLPFLTAIAREPPRALATSLPALVTPPVTSPWTPEVKAAESTEPIAVAPPRDLAAEKAQLDAARTEAVIAGRAEGLRETDALRERLAMVIAELELARTAVIPPAADLIADAATTVVAAWVEGGNRKELFAPVVRAWLARCHEPATARVHPDDVAAMTEAAGDAPIKIVGDDAIARGNLAIAGGNLEVSHAWEPRLRELREAIAAAIDEAR